MERGVGGRGFVFEDSCFSSLFASPSSRIILFLILFLPLFLSDPVSFVSFLVPLAGHSVFKNEGFMSLPMISLLSPGNTYVRPASRSVQSM